MKKRTLLLAECRALVERALPVIDAALVPCCTDFLVTGTMPPVRNRKDPRIQNYEHPLSERMTYFLMDLNFVLHGTDSSDARRLAGLLAEINEILRNEFRQ